jgi:hypothetical protein
VEVHHFGRGDVPFLLGLSFCEVKYLGLRLAPIGARER